MSTRGIKITQSYTQRDSETLTKYLNEIKQIKVLTPDDENDLAVLAFEGNEEARNLLVECNLRFVVSVAKQYISKTVTLEDLINEGNIGLVEASKRFDPTKGFKFITYAVWWIRRNITAYVSNHNSAIRLPNNRIADVSKVKGIIAMFEHKENREPFEFELVELIPDMSIEDIREACRLIDNTSTSIDAKDEDGFSMSDVMVDELFGEADSNLMFKDSEENIDKILSVLDERECEIIRLSLGIGCQKITLNEIGNKFDMTREAARLIKMKGLKKLKVLLHKNPSLYESLLS